MFNPYLFINNKKNGLPHSPNQINNFITQVGSIQALEKIFNKPLRSIRSDYWEEIENVLYIDRFRYKLFGGVDVSRKEVLDFFRRSFYFQSFFLFIKHRPPSGPDMNYYIHRILFYSKYSFIFNFGSRISIFSIGSLFLLGL